MAKRELHKVEWSCDYCGTVSVVTTHNPCRRPTGWDHFVDPLRSYSVLDACASCTAAFDAENKAASEESDATRDSEICRVP